MKYCSHCGHELREGVKVCPNCGHHILDTQPKKKGMSKKNKSIIIITALILLALIIAFFVVSQFLSPDKQLANISESIEEENATLLIENIDNDISKTDAEAYFAYINEAGSKDTVLEDLDKVRNTDFNNSMYEEVEDGMNLLLTVEEKGKQYLIFKNYNIEIPKVSVYSYDDFNIDEFTYQYNGKDRRWNGTTDKVMDLIPGIYSFEGTSKIGEDEYSGLMNVDLTDSEHITFNPGYYNISLTENISFSSIDIDYDDIAIKVNGEDRPADFSQYEVNIGPFKIGEEVNIETLVNTGGKQLINEGQVVNPTEDELNFEYMSSGIVEPTVRLELEHDQDKLREVADEQMNAEMKKTAQKDFEENLEDNAKLFVENYLYALESMYLFEDINEVEDFVEEGSGVYNTLVNNINSGTFEGMFIFNVSVTNYSKENNTITLTANTERDYDALPSSQSFKTVYTINYDPENLRFTIVDFRDI